MMPCIDKPPRKVTGLLTDIHVIIQGGLVLTSTLLLVDVYKQSMDYVVPSAWSLLAQKWCVCFVMICITLISSRTNWSSSRCCCSRVDRTQSARDYGTVRVRVRY
jgi:hypothetical protein